MLRHLHQVVDGQIFFHGAGTFLLLYDERFAAKRRLDHPFTEDLHTESTVAFTVWWGMPFTRWQCNAIKNSGTMKLPLYTKMGSSLCMIQFVRFIYAHANIQHAITLNSCPYCCGWQASIEHMKQSWNFLNIPISCMLTNTQAPETKFLDSQVLLFEYEMLFCVSLQCTLQFQQCGHDEEAHSIISVLVCIFGEMIGIWPDCLGCCWRACHMLMPTMLGPLLTERLAFVSQQKYMMM